MPFVKGQSGNPAGRPLGARNGKTLAAEALFQARAEEVVDFAVEKALAGNVGALRACLDRLVPPRRDRPVPFVLPPTVSAADTERAVADIRAGVGTGEITPREALALLQIVEKSVRIVAMAHAVQAAREGAAVAGEAVAASKTADGRSHHRQTAEETMKYNDVPAVANGAQQAQETLSACAQGTAQPTDGTTKYNEPPARTDGAAATPPRVGAGQKTTRYNGPRGLMDSVAHFTPPFASKPPPSAPAVRAVSPSLSSAA